MDGKQQRADLNGPFGDRGGLANVHDLCELAEQKCLSPLGPMGSEAKDADSVTRTNLADTS